MGEKHVSAELPNFHIPHADKIEWMIETSGWALEPVPADPDVTPPTPGYSYTIGLPALTGFAEIVICGLTSAAASGLLRLVVDMLQGGTEIPLGVELLGLLDNELRCVFAPVGLAEHGHLFATANAWYRGAQFDMVQLLWPDRNGFLPTEVGFAQNLRLAQPVLGTL